MSSKNNTMSSKHKSGQLQTYRQTTANPYNLLTHEEISSSSILNRQPTLDVSNLKRNFRDISPTNITNFYESSGDLSVLVPYQDLKVQNTMDLRKLHELKRNAKSYKNLLHTNSKQRYTNYNNGSVTDRKPCTSQVVNSTCTAQKHPRSANYSHKNSIKQKSSANSSKSYSKYVNSQSFHQNWGQPDGILLNPAKREEDYMDMQSFKEKLNKTISIKNQEAKAMASMHANRQIVPEIGIPDNVYNSHQRNYTMNNIQQPMNTEWVNSKLLNSSRDVLRDNFGSFRTSNNIKSFCSKSKPVQTKAKSKKRSRNKNMSIGISATQNKYNSKSIKSTIGEGKCFINNCTVKMINSSSKKSIFTPSKKEISYAMGSTLDNRKSTSNLTKTKKKKPQVAMNKMKKCQSSRNFIKIHGSNHRLSGVHKPSSIKSKNSDRSIHSKPNFQSPSFGGLSSRQSYGQERQR